MWRPGSTRLFDGFKRSLDASDQASDQELSRDTTQIVVQSSNCKEAFLAHEQPIELFLLVRGATTLLPSIPCKKLKEKWLGNSTMKLCFCDRIRILLGVRIASLFGVSGEMVAALTVLAAGIWIWSSKVEALPQAPSHPKELSIPQYSDYSSSTLHRGWARR